MCDLTNKYPENSIIRIPERLFRESFALLSCRKKGGKAQFKSLQKEPEQADIHEDIPLWCVQKSGDLQTGKNGNKEDGQETCFVWLAGQETVLTDGIHSE